MHKINQYPPHNTFYKTVDNLSENVFTHDVTVILNKGLKCNLHVKQKNWITKLALEANTAISLLNLIEQNHL
jgi:hypothetical protein